MNKYLKKFENLDINTANFVFRYIIKHRLKMYIILIVFGIIFTIPKIPYLNLLVDVITLFKLLIVYVLVLMIIKFNEVKLYKASLLGLVIIAFFALIKNENIAENLGIIVFLLLSTAVLISIRSLFINKTKDE